MKYKAFTLIELLIVVAIIAILAAIAVPNFLEAQVRSKVSRTKGDLRTVATAVELYTVDHNRTPTVLTGYPGAQDRRGGPSMVSKTLAGTKWNSYRFWRITTPIAYISTLPLDVFALNGQTVQIDGTPSDSYDAFDYVDDRHDTDMGQGVNRGAGISSGAKWRLASAGPDRIQCYGGSIAGYSRPEMNRNGIDYDPTNGTVSRGDIVRVGGPGQLPAASANLPAVDRVLNRYNAPGL